MIERIVNIISRKVDGEIQPYFDGKGYKEHKRTHRQHYDVFNEDKTRRFVFHEYGGEEYEGNWSRNLELFVLGKDNRGWGEVMRVQEYKYPDGRIYHIVYLEVVDEHPTWLLRGVSYHSEHNGILNISESWSGGGFVLFGDDKDGGISITGVEDRRPFLEEDRAYSIEQGHYHLSELPESIDIKATIDEFCRQIQNRDFGKPRLIEPHETIKLDPNQYTFK